MKITTENIQVGFHARQILKGISMESQDKELVGIIGPNGSGKSTLGEIFGDLQQPTSGIVRYKGQDLRSLGEKEYR
ncbi:ABC transporter ATP-binding protein, partial [Klebsiella pneumoniae]|nr:ABC transporter ATP-binding protein [Klebsiella pneumoniae]